MPLFNPDQVKFIEKYPLMNEYLKNFRHKQARHILGRDDVVRSVLANLARKEITNVALTGNAGVGKTAVVTLVSQTDKKRLYFEADLALMASSGQSRTDGSVEMASRLKKMFNEISDFQREIDKQVVIFMDEFHLIAQESTTALQALKPLLAESGRRNYRIIVATTGDEYDKYIRGDEALSERLQSVKVEPASDEMTLDILRDMKRAYVPQQRVPDSLLKNIVAVTNRYLPSQAQPRKSVKVFDAMLGWNQQFGNKFDETNMAMVLHTALGVNIDHRMDVEKIQEYLSHRVIDQEYAVRAICNRLYMVMAGLTDNTRPLASFLFSGSTGVGKTEMVKATAHVMYGSDDRMIRFDMSEFSSSASADSFRAQLATKVWETPSAIILLDEFEKASPEVAKLLLQVLDDAELSDRHGRPVSFKNTIIVLTTNAGHEVYKKFNQSHAINSAEAEAAQANLTAAEKEVAADDSLQSYQALIEDSLQAVDSFPPELLGRIDSIVPFNPLQRHGRVEITKIQLRKLQTRMLLAKDVNLHFDSNVINLIVDEETSSDTDAGGGRDVVRQINAKITTPVAKFVVFHPQYKQVSVNVKGQFKADNVHLLHGRLHVEVEPWAGSRSIVREGAL